MATKEFYHNIDLVNVGQLLGARLQNVTTTEETALAATLGVDNTGLIIYNTEELRSKIWDGTQFQTQEIEVAGDVIFKGIIEDLSDPANVMPVSGYQYIIGPGLSGTLTLTGVTFLPSAVVEPGDTVLFTSPTVAYVFQRNDEQATETVLGNVRLATQAEVTAGVDALEAVTPATLKGALLANFYTRQYTATVSVPAATPLTVTHGLNLVDRNAFQVNTMRNNNQISLDVDSVDSNAITLTSLVALTNVVVTVTGASAA